MYSHWIDTMFFVISLWVVSLRPGLKHFELFHQGKYSHTLLSVKSTTWSVFVVVTWVVGCFDTGQLEYVFLRQSVLILFIGTKNGNKCRILHHDTLKEMEGCNPCRSIHRHSKYVYLFCTSAFWIKACFHDVNLQENRNFSTPFVRTSNINFHQSKPNSSKSEICGRPLFTFILCNLCKTHNITRS